MCARTCVCICVFVHACVYEHTHADALGGQSYVWNPPGVRVTQSCEPPDMGTTVELWPSLRTNVLFN